MSNKTILCVNTQKHLVPAGFAVVKLATDRKSGEEFAVKIMALPEPNAKAGDNENTRCRPHQLCVLMAAFNAAYTWHSSKSLHCTV